MAGVEAKQVIDAYQKLREQRSQLKRAYEADDEVLKDKMRKLDAWLLKTMDEVGTDQLKGNGSIAFITTSDRANASDWGEFWNWLAENKRLDMLEKRVSTKTVMEYYREFAELPPGISVSIERTVNVRKA